MGHDHGGSLLLSSFVTGFVVAIPEAAVSYAGKVVSVFVLAIVAELGRRLINRLWKGEKKS